MNDYLQYLNLAGILGLLGFVWKIANGNKRKVSYDSFDRYKKEVENKVRTKEVCDERHEEIKVTLKEIKEDVKYLVRLNSKE